MGTMGTTFVVMTTLKLCAMGGVGIGLTSMYQYFNNFEFKSKKKEKGGESDVTSIGENLRAKSRSIS